MAVHVGVVSLELHIPAARSLKDKRRVVRSLVERLHRRHRVSVAETDLHDLHQRAEISLAVVSHDGGELERVLDGLRSQAEEAPGAMLLRWDLRLLDAVNEFDELGG